MRLLKTFRLVSLQIVEEDNLKDIELEDGLIINKEDENRTWLVEAFIAPEYFDYFQAAFEDQRDMYTQVIITKKENEPAVLKSKVCCVKKLESHVSVLLEGTFVRTKYRYAELVLTDLINDGLNGKALLDAFKEKIKNKPKFITAKMI